MNIYKIFCEFLKFCSKEAVADLHILHYIQKMTSMQMFFIDTHNMRHFIKVAWQDESIALLCFEIK